MHLDLATTIIPLLIFKKTTKIPFFNSTGKYAAKRENKIKRTCELEILFMA